MRLLKALVVLITASTFAAPISAQVVILRTNAGTKTQVAPGSKLTVPVIMDMSAAGGLTIYQIIAQASWYSSVLTLDSVRAGGFANLTPGLGSASSGLVSLDANAGSSLVTSTTTVANLYFTASASQSATTLSLTASSLSDGEVSLRNKLRAIDLDVCVAPSGKWGDANNDNVINIIDAQQIARFSVGLTVANAAVVAANGDVTGDNAVNIIDAQQVARFSVGLTAAARVNASTFTPPPTNTLNIQSTYLADYNAYNPGASADLSALPVGYQVRVRPIARDVNLADITACAPITYSSSAPSVASVNSNGIVTAVSAGTATITVTSGTKTATVNVTTFNYGTLATKAGTSLSVDPVGTASPSVSPVFTARDGSGVLAAGVNIDMSIYGTGCLFQQGGGTYLTLSSDASGEVRPTVLLPSYSTGGGCVVYANSSNPLYPDEASATMIVYPAGATHVWTGVADTSWTNVANWVRPSSTPAVPTSTSMVFIPYSVTNPSLVANAQVAGVMIEDFTYFEMNGKRLDVGSGGVVGQGYFNDGTVRATATASLAGNYGTLEIGQPSSCGGASPMTVRLGPLNAGMLDVYCKAQVDSNFDAAADSIFVRANGGQGSVTVNYGGYLQVNGNAFINGDSFANYGDVYVGGDAVLGGQSVTVGGRGYVYVAGNATFNAVAASYSGLQTRVTVEGNMTVGGGSAGQQQFIGGSLEANGDITQLPGAVPNTFATSGDHWTYLFGTTNAVITMSNAAANPFTHLVVDKRPSNVVALGSDLAISKTAGSTSGSYLLLYNGTLWAKGSPTPRTITITNGDIRVQSPAVLLIDGAMVVTGGTCIGRGFGGIINGSGTINGGTTSAYSCP